MTALHLQSRSAAHKSKTQRHKPTQPLLLLLLVMIAQRLLCSQNIHDSWCDIPTWHKSLSTLGSTALQSTQAMVPTHQQQQQGQHRQVPQDQV
jgi:hypothetical protein